MDIDDRKTLLIICISLLIFFGGMGIARQMSENRISPLYLQYLETVKATPNCDQKILTFSEFTKNQQN
jgi:hypothetical protein